ncbi:MAG: malectin domain-containing carbohydrate-binding protein, partial [Pseudomonadota bacterium]
GVDGDDKLFERNARENHAAGNLFEVNGEDVTFLADQGGSAPAAQFVTAGSEGGGGSKIYNGGGSASTVQAQDFGPGALSELHWDERSSAEKYYGYEIPVVENGTYRVDIYSAEIFHGVVGSTFENNKRVFDVVIEGETVADNFDHFDIDPSAPAKEIIHSYEFEITDGAFTLDIDARGSAGGIDQPKLSAFALYKIGAGTPVTDDEVPVIASVTVANPQGVQDDARDAIITVTDNSGLDAAALNALDGTELTFADIVPSVVSAPEVTISADGKTATLVYTLTPPAGGWDKGVGEVSIAAGAYPDAAGNGSVATTTAFVFEPNLGNQERGAVVFAVNAGTTDTSDATGLAPDPLDGGAVDNNRYAGAIAADSVILDAFGNPVAFEADNAAYYTSPKGNGGLNNNVDGQLGTTGSNAGGVDLDGSALHTYRDSNAASWTATYDGFDAGTYVVELHFAELFHASPGSRVGTFTVNGIPV